MFSRILKSKITTAILVLILFVFIFKFLERKSSNDEVSLEVEALEAKINEVKSGNRQYYDVSNKEYLEQQARLRLNYRLPDEKVVYVYQAEKENKRDGLYVNTDDKKDVSNWEKWWEYLFK